MATFMDRSSPRRGLSSSLNRNKSFCTTNGNSSSTNNPLNRDLDKFTRYFLIKTVQVIVQSRLGADKGVRTECKPSGNDWFNLNITDIKDVSEKAKAALDKLCLEGFTIKTSWRVCCEISVRTNEGQTIVLELWIITNKSKLDENVAMSSQPLPTATRKEFNSNDVLSSNIVSNDNTKNLLCHESESFMNNGSSIGMRSSLTEHQLNRAACASPTGPRTILENIQSQTDAFVRNNETLLRDIKASVSCTSLSSAASNAPNAIVASPSTNSLTGQQQQTSLPSKTNYSSSTTSTIYSIYNKMSLTLKTLITTTRISPAFQLANRGQSANSYEVCYRIYACPHEPTNIETDQKNGFVDASHLARKKSPLPFNIDMRDFVGEEDVDRFSPFTRLGSIRSDLNDLDISFCYRTDMSDSHNGKTNNRTVQEFSHRSQFNEECITAAKQLLLANNCSKVNDTKLDVNLKDFDKTPISSNERFESSLKDIDQPLCAAFASGVAANVSTPDLTVLEPAFTTLLPPKSMSNGTDKSNGQKRVKELTNGLGSGDNTVDLDQKVNAQSSPIQIPLVHTFGHLRDSPTRSNDSAPKSLTDSFVFVDLNPPFATDDQSELTSFFHGPSPTFSNGFDVLKDVNELTNQLAVLEANVDQIDDFVDTICALENEDDDDICDHLAAVTAGCSFAAQSTQSSKHKNNLITGDHNMMRDRCRTVSDEQINLNHIQSI